MKNNNKMGLSCRLEKEHSSLFFSIMDCLNNKFISNNWHDIFDFYSVFENTRELYNWMKERPRGTANIHEVDGYKDVIVVIPTADFNGKYARECREDIFKGLHIIFVESGNVPDPYFNYAHNCNVGIIKALEYKPKWVVVSNDDIYKIDDVSVLVREMAKIDNSRYKCVFTDPPGKYHSMRSKLAKPNIIRNILYSFSNKLKSSLILEKKFGVTLLDTKSKGIVSLLFTKGYKHLSIADFGIFSSKFLEEMNGNLFDETYINAAEDVDISLRLTCTKEPYTFVKFKLGDYIGSSLGNRGARRLRDIASNSYLNHKIKNGAYCDSGKCSESK